MNNFLAACATDDDCLETEVCCPLTSACEVENAPACGDPDMTGFLGQKFDFSGQDGLWYALISELPDLHINMRITAPVRDLPVITYITGLSVIALDAVGVPHTIVITVTEPHNIRSSCDTSATRCLAEGSLTVLLDDDEALSAPGTEALGPVLEVAAVNLPGECRSFGFEKYWERKKKESAAEAAGAMGRRRLGVSMDMSEWVLDDPTAINMAECTGYVSRSLHEPGELFAHQSEHASFQIVTPKVTIRLNHGRLHQLPTRDRTDQFDLPDHLTWQMNMAVDRTDISRKAMGVLGETFEPTRDASGNPIMQGKEAIRGAEIDYLVDGPLGTDFKMGRHES